MQFCLEEIVSFLKVHVGVTIGHCIKIMETVCSIRMRLAFNFRVDVVGKMLSKHEIVRSVL